MTEPLNQLEIDVAEYVLDNWTELKKECSPNKEDMDYYKVHQKLFETTHNEFVNSYIIETLKEKLQQTFNLNSETISLIFTDEYINMILTKEFFVH